MITCDVTHLLGSRHNIFFYVKPEWKEDFEYRPVFLKFSFHSGSLKILESKNEKCWYCCFVYLLHVVLLWCYPIGQLFAGQSQGGASAALADAFC